MSDLSSHPQLLALLDAARLSPHDDTPRLVLADWLDEYGEPERAEFLRLQCRLAREGSLREESVRRMDELLIRHGGAWAGPLWCQHTTGHDWHRGLLCLHLRRRPEPTHLADILPWIDTLHVEAHGWRRLQQVVALLNTAPLNHVTLTLRRAFRETDLLTLLSGVRDAPALRTLTFRLSRPAGRRSDRTASGLSERFLSRLVSELPLGRQLTHVAVGPHLEAAHAQLLHGLGVTPIEPHDLHWMRSLPPTAFQPRQRPR